MKSLIKKSRFFAFLLLFTGSFIFAEPKGNFGCVYGISSIPFAALKGFSDQDISNSFTVEFYKSYESLLTAFLNKKIDACLVPFETGLKLMEYSPKEILCGGVTQKSNVYFLTSDDTVKSYVELLGKSISIPKEDVSAQKFFNWIAGQYGIPINKGPRGLTLNDLDTSVQMVPKVASRQIKYAIISEPYASLIQLKNNRVKRVIDFQKQFDSILGTFSYFPETILVVHKDYAKSEDYKSFEEYFHTTVNYANENPVKNAEWNYKYNVFGSEYVITIAGERLNFCFINKNSAIDDFILSAEILFSENNFVRNLTEKNFCFFE